MFTKHHKRDDGPIGRGDPKCSAWTIVVALSSTMLAACGGTSDAEAGSGPTTPDISQADRGGLPAECDAEDGHEFRWIDDFETGAATGWYTNTDVCQECNDLDGDRSDLEKPIGCLLGALAGHTSKRAQEITQATSALTPPA